jgi:endogenous inhibitor of DNA gyrase (YacG/DUF329 family)
MGLRELFLQKTKCHIIDLTKVEGSGDVKCPTCGTTISPDDDTEDTYTILETEMKGDRLDRMTLKCNKCQTQIRLTGFQLLNDSR